MPLGTGVLTVSFIAIPFCNIQLFKFILYTDICLKILRDDSACPGACQVIQW